MTDKERFKRYIEVNVDTGCWNWTGGVNPKGYGRFGIKKNGEWRLYYAHRVSYEWFVGPIPEGVDVLHDCDNPSCVNHEHLHLGDQSVNAKEAYKRGQMDATGVNNGQAKLTEEQVIAIRDDGRMHLEIAKEYGISKSNVSAIKTKRSWSHV